MPQWAAALLRQRIRSVQRSVGWMDQYLMDQDLIHQCFFDLSFLDQCFKMLSKTAQKAGFKCAWACFGKKYSSFSVTALFSVFTVSQPKFIVLLSGVSVGHARDIVCGGLLLCGVGMVFKLLRHLVKVLQII